jgi:Protein of unknown function (DUF2786)
MGFHGQVHQEAATMKYVFDDGGRTASKHDEVNDCACRAIAIATERPYHEIWTAFRTILEAEGPRRRSGVDESVQHKLMESLGWTWVPTQKAHLREDDLPAGRLVVCIKGHSVAVVNGVIHDTFNPSRKKSGSPPHVYGYYKKGRTPASEQGMSVEQKKVLDAVAKILALADSTNYEAEAATARAKAAELIARYDIAADSMKDLEKFKHETEFRIGDVPSYEFSLLCTLGKFCGVLVMSSPRQHGGRNYEFFGKPQDIEAFRYMRDIVVSQLDRAWMEYEVGHHHTRESVRWKNSFADGVEAKIHELLKDAERQQKVLRQDVVLIPREEQATKEWECLFGKLRSSRGYDGGDNAHGFEAGKNVSLSRGVKSGGPLRYISGPR